MDMMICIIDFSKREIKYSGARSIAYLVRNGEATELKPSRYGIGFQPKVKEKFFEDATIAFEAKDMLYFVSDGFQDQFSEHKSKLRRKNFVRILCDVSHADIYQQSIALKETFHAWKGGASQTDDVMVVGLRL
jgi:serine phosphatase RsbU (regulator of sigma subunit)